MIWSILGKVTTSGKLRSIAAKAVLFGLALVVLLVGYAWGSDEPQIIESPIASNLSFGSSNNKNIAMAGVDVDIDGNGNGIGEIAVIRENLNGIQRLKIFNAPTTVGEETGLPKASDLSFGDANTNNNRIAIAGVDIDGDGFDEIAVLEQKLNGIQRLKIFSAPEGGETGPPIASDMTFGKANTNNNRIAIAGVDIDGDGFDEIAVLEQKLNGRQRLKIFNAPIGGETGDPIASDLTFGNATTDNNRIAIAGIDINGDGFDEIAVLEQKLNGRQRLKIFNLPIAVGGETGPPIASDLTFGNATTNNNRIAIAGIDINGDGIHEIAVLEQKLNGVQRLKIFNAPQGLQSEGSGEPSLSPDLSTGESEVESDGQGAEADESDDEQETDEIETTRFYGGAYSPNTSGGTNAAGEETEEKKQKESNQPAKSPNLLAKKRPAVSRRPRRIEPKTRTSGGSGKAGIRHSERLGKRNTRRRTNIVSRSVSRPLSFFNDEGIPNVYIKGILHCGAGDPRNVAIAQLGDGKKYRIREGDIFSNSDIKVVVIFPRRLQLQYKQHIFEVEI